jgi:hypothetical protein
VRPGSRDRHWSPPSPLREARPANGAVLRCQRADGLKLPPEAFGLEPDHQLRVELGIEGPTCGWPALMARVRAALDERVAHEVLVLGRAWSDLKIAGFTPGELRASAERVLSAPVRVAP